MGARRIAMYFSWDWAKEAGADPGMLDNRFPTLYELRRAIWPHYEHHADKRQGIDGFLEHVILEDFQAFAQTVRDTTSLDPLILHRVTAGAHSQPINTDTLRTIDTMIVVSLDHCRTQQEATREEIDSLRTFIEREGTCLVISPHHDVGAPTDAGAGGEHGTRIVELRHHGDRLVPSQQRLGGFASSLFAGLGLPIQHRFGLSPAAAMSGEPAPIERIDRDERGILNGVTTFNLHAHLPHLAITRPEPWLKVLARQPINPAAEAHPFVAAGNRSFNAMLWAKPDGGRKGDIFITDATLWSAAFSGLPSLRALWTNLATLR